MIPSDIVGGVKPENPHVCPMIVGRDRPESRSKSETVELSETGAFNRTNESES